MAFLYFKQRNLSSHGCAPLMEAWTVKPVKRIIADQVIKILEMQPKPENILCVNQYQLPSQLATTGSLVAASINEITGRGFALAE